MAANIIWRKDQLVKFTNLGALRERKIIGYPLEETPLKAYSNIFYWSHIVSEFGCTIHDKPLIGFEIFTYVIKGKYETHQQGKENWIELKEEDVEIIQAGKGTRLSERYSPNSEIIKIWFDPGFNFHQHMNPLHSNFEGKSFQRELSPNRETIIISNRASSDNLFTKDVSVYIEKFRPGKHIISCIEDFALSVYVIEGYMDLRNITFSYNDFFTIDGKQQLTLNVLSDCKLLIITSPLKPEYQTYSEMYV